MSVLEIFELVFAIFLVSDLLYFIIFQSHGASNFTSNICRPIFGRIGSKSIGMVIGFIIRLVECAVACFLIFRLLF